MGYYAEGEELDWLFNTRLYEAARSSGLTDHEKESILGVSGTRVIY